MVGFLLWHSRQVRKLFNNIQLGEFCLDIYASISLQCGTKQSQYVNWNRVTAYLDFPKLYFCGLFSIWCLTFNWSWAVITSTQSLQKSTFSPPSISTLTSSTCLSLSWALSADYVANWNCSSSIWLFPWRDTWHIILQATQGVKLRLTSGSSKTLTGV